MPMLVKVLLSFTLLLGFGDGYAADLCDQKKDSGDGVPAAYYIHECKGMRALNQKDAKAAEFHFRQALSQPLHEAPNYELKVELAEALCLLGRREEARREISEFMCMAAADLGEVQCETKEGRPNPALSPSCYAVCVGYGSGLSSEGRNELLTRRFRAKKVLASCAGPNKSMQPTPFGRR